VAKHEVGAGQRWAALRQETCGGATSHTLSLSISKRKVYRVTGCAPHAMHDPSRMARPNMTSSSTRRCPSSSCGAVQVVELSELWSYPKKVDDYGGSRGWCRQGHRRRTEQ
jgi:hypothetical protein